ncbi:MAG: aminoacyl--tRNA ligase-related protein, partial [Patescibacteria group bacterium]
MLDINLIRKNPDLVKEGIRKKNVDPKFVDKFLRLDETWRNKVTILDHLKSEQNNLNKELWKHRTKDSLSRAQVLKKRVSQVEAEVRGAQDKRDEILRQFPNLPFEDVPIGKDDSENKVIREVGEKPKFDFKPKTYLELGESLNLINVKKASEVSGSRFGYLLGDAALLEFALVDLAFKATLKKNFIPVVPPVMVKPSVMVGMGKIKFTETGEAFYLPKDNLYLVGSAEHTLGPLHLNYIFEEKDLPRRYVGFSTCFRREAGSYGKDTKGILRVHQFDKV